MPSARAGSWTWRCPTGRRSNCFLSRHRRHGLRHLAFAVQDVAQCKRDLEAQGVVVEDIRVDEYTGRRFTFFADPDGLPLELYEDS